MIHLLFDREDPSLGECQMIHAGVEYGHERIQRMITYDVGFLPTLDRGEISVCIAVDSKKQSEDCFYVPGNGIWKI